MPPFKEKNGETIPAVDQGLLEILMVAQLNLKHHFGAYESKSRSQAIGWQLQ
jgi:hypothetical protein